MMEKHTEMRKISDTQNWLLTHTLLVKIVLIAKMKGSVCTSQRDMLPIAV